MRLIPFLPPYLSWPSQVCQYAPTGEPGIRHETHEVSGMDVECLLYRDETGALVGVLSFFPQNYPPYESIGAFTVLVDPDHQRQGIGTALVTEAHRRWVLDLDDQTYTPDGYALIAAFILNRVPVL